ncbi:RluA family pseudouridine synthase [Lapidilactobacillus bayanensis]|uniref:RluA family pseudouridine synthase n=1 Tax=Lapidilactobacillus bayanensis TaxID=2485998 RepID=UPI000F794A6F|nr:RluA family pseudouridine synthase [Lapidilactobacillus bayanensis]
MQTNFQIVLPQNFNSLTIRQLLQYWLVPKKWQHFLRIEQMITVNGRYHSFNELVQTGDLIQLDFAFLPANRQDYLTSATQKPEILFEDATTLIVNKPAGIKTHPNRPDENGTMLNLLKTNHSDVLIVHRLDQQTSGALLVAKSTVAVPIYNRQLTNKTMKRHYLAWVDDPKHILTTGKITLPIGQDPHDQRKRCVDRLNGLTATTNYQTVKHQDGRSLVALDLETGRTHQIRVHLAAIGHPIIGDPLYNPNPHSLNNGQMLLHGDQITFTPPFSFTAKTVSAPLPEYFPN